MSRKYNSVLSSSRNPHGSTPQQMSLFPEEKPGKDLERMKIKTLLRSFYKTSEINVTGEQAG